MASHNSVQQKELVFAVIMAGVAAGVVAAASLLKLGTQPANSGPGGSLLLVQSGDGRRAPGVTTAPGINSAQINQRLLSAAATTGGDLEVSLAWNGTSDLDLELREPSGELITAYHPRSTSGGIQDVDANPTWLTEEGEQRYRSGQIPGAENVREVPEMFFELDGQPGLPQGFTLPGADGKASTKFSRTPVEHIYFNHAPRGTYTVFVSCYSWRERFNGSMPCTVQIRSHGQVFHEVSGPVGPANYCANGARPGQWCQFQVR